MHEKIASDAPALSVHDDRAFRRRATIRSWVCPGAGFAFLGRNGAALLTYTATLGLLPAATWVALQPRAAAAWAALGVFALAAALSLTEQVACRRATLRPPGPGFLVAGLPVAGTLVWAAAVGALVVLFFGFGSLRMGGTGMSPTLEKGERLLYSKRINPDRLGRGAVILYQLSERSAWGQPGSLTLSRILAVPGDRLSVRGGAYVVNGAVGPAVADTRPYAPVVSVPSEPDGITVPEGHYFITQDDPEASYDSRVLSWVEGRHVVANQMFYLSHRGLLNPVD